ncbi:hypothetical protein L6164_027961 [Bauhinia variegata]|uniref:Uncharacterized protein n=1 Tax=Bauhinia variegata TaxID=167791 RepID=A0ACB9LUH5_BAUVA|nr:hypothetical protein L6164_027961 [Bauhinia variegata]
MATAISTDKSNSRITKIKPPRPKRICFSYAAYAKAVIERLQSANIPVAEGLSDAELSTVESAHNFCLPPDLRSILQVGLPISPDFPNWRSSSPQQLQILLNLPVLSILRRVSKHKFWHPSWGPKPVDAAQALDTARHLLTRAPLLVPIYRHCYIPSSPNLAGNPIFYIDRDGHVRLLSLDVAGFFRKADFLSDASGSEDHPVWAATAPRRIEFWSDLAGARLDTRGGWWWSCLNGQLASCLEQVFWRLRDGGWREDEIRDMMMMMNGGDDDKDREEEEGQGECEARSMPLAKGKEGMVWHARVLSLVLLRAGWSREDVVYSLGVTWDDEGKSRLDFPQEPTPPNH